MQCPVGSNSTGGTVSECACNDGLATTDGSTTTTSAPCDRCKADHYNNGVECVLCPTMSGRVFVANEAACTCMVGRATGAGDTTTIGDDCTGE